jgi:hypothetical protein
MTRRSLSTSRTLGRRSSDKTYSCALTTFIATDNSSTAYGQPIWKPSRCWPQLTYSEALEDVTIHLDRPGPTPLRCTSWRTVQVLVDGKSPDLDGGNSCELDVLTEPQLELLRVVELDRVVGKCEVADRTFELLMKDHAG